MTGVLRDSKRFGQTIGAARGWNSQERPEFAALIGTSVPTLRKWEAGDFSSNYRTVDQRRALAERIVRRTKCPAEWFELEAVDVGGDARELIAQHEGVIRMLVEHLDLQDEAELARLSADVDQLFGTSTQTSGESDLGAASE